MLTLCLRVCMNVYMYQHLNVSSLHHNLCAHPQAVEGAGKPVLRKHGLRSCSSDQCQRQWAAEHVERRRHTVTDRQQCVSTRRWTQNYCMYLTQHWWSEWMSCSVLSLIVVYLFLCAEMVFLHTDIGSSIVKRCMKVPKPMDVCPYLIYLWVIQTLLIYTLMY